MSGSTYHVEFGSDRNGYSFCVRFGHFLLFIVLCFDSLGVIEILINSGRQIDAVNLAFAFELTEQFSPVPLLKSYLKEARKASSPLKPGNASPTAQVCS